MGGKAQSVSASDRYMNPATFGGANGASGARATPQGLHPAWLWRRRPTEAEPSEKVRADLLEVL